ncbi:sigma 54 modulation/S30EA ribosomal C-terminal domain-containing protein [Pseudonocardia sp. CA-142604]|uniref:sigma 54 modulation/S30EA ribosomal C-terminal domain-containing protein n=1 Tax=Pseudonocardia sp. CA-142604 TaxID=3240024 RepID=UPI003D8DEEFB
MHGSNSPPVPIEVQVTGVHSDAFVAEVSERTRAALRHAGRPVLHARVRITRDGDPERPIVAQANIDLDGRLVRVQVHGGTDRDALARLEERLRNRLQHVSRTAGTWEDRRGRSAPSMAGPPPGDEQTEWRHGDLPTRRGPSYPRPPAERQIIRHKSFSVAESEIDEAAFDMDSLDYDFHLFTELGTGQDSVLYRGGPTGYRIAQVEPHPESLAPHALEVTVSTQPAADLSTDEAIERMAALDLPFLFYLDRERGRGALLYHRYDGHYGLISPADSE